MAVYVASNLWTAQPGYADLRGGTVDWGDPSSGTSDVFLVDVAVSAASGLAVAILALGSQGAGSPLDVATMVGPL